MCGIAGVFYRDGRTADDRVLERMAAQIEHRGPDAWGVKSFAGGGLAHRRLKIIDLTEAAAQPMGAPEGGVWISFNGEIYNFQTLRDELSAKGHQFRSTGDTEVILRLYLEYGPEAIARLDGMFALAIWNERTKSLLLARDRTGKKPLYVYDDGKKVVFASEIKSILVHPDVDDGGWHGALPLYLTYGYVPTPRTMYEKVRKLPPASLQLFALGETMPSEPRDYWDFPVADQQAADGGTRRVIPVKEAASTVRSLFTDAVKRRMVSDVPLGAFLSGGVDSTLVVGVMSQLAGRPIKTFSIGFEGAPEYDETHFARLAAKRFGTEHTEFRVKPESFDLIEKLAWHYDEPFGDSSAIPTYIVSKLTREHVTVALTGDGGDEVFAGYGRFYAAQLAENLPRPLMRALRAMASPVPGGDNFRSIVNRGKRFLARASEDLPERFRGWISFFTQEELQEMLAPELLSLAKPEMLAESYSSALGRCRNADLVNRLLYLNSRTYLLDDLNVKVDRASMATSLEARAPFLDTALMDYAFRLPGEMKLRGRTTKWILKKAFEDILPPEIVRRPKMGFGVPLGAWFRGELKGFLQDRLLDPGSRIYPFIRRPFIEKMFREHQSRQRDWGGHFWVLAMLEIFLRSRKAGARNAA
jgi:asparagine synthase (glutamine-hydrolysing)